MSCSILFGLLNRKPKEIKVTKAEIARQDLNLLTKTLTSKRFTEKKEILIPLCGDGSLVQLYAEHEAELVVGTDPRGGLRTHWKALQKEHPSLPMLFLSEPGDALPYPDASFDLVVLQNQLEYADNPKALLEEAARLLRPQGLLCISMIPKYAPHAAGTAMIPMSYATLLSSSKTRSAFIDKQCKRLEDGALIRESLLTMNERGQMRLKTESRLTLSALLAHIKDLSGMKMVKALPQPTKKAFKSLCKVGGIKEICTERLILVLEKEEIAEQTDS